MRNRIWLVAEQSLFALNILIVFFLFMEARLEVPAWLHVVGRMHPMFLHFPIVLLLIAIVIDWFSSGDQERRVMKGVVDRLFLIGALTASLTVVMGIFLSSEGGYDAELLGWHKWLGVAIAAVAFALVMIRKRGDDPRLLLRGLYSATVFLVVAGAHFGAGLTHGEDFLVSPLLAEEEDKPLVPFEEARVFDDLIRPVLDQKCMGCHNEKKAKGSLIMTDSAHLVAGGKTGVSFVRHDPGGSLMLERIRLAADHKKHMPPKGKPQLTEEEKTLLHYWILEGAPFGQRIASRDADDTLRALALATWSSIPETESSPTFQFAAARQEDVASLQNEYRVIYPLYASSPALGVNFYNADAYRGEALRELQRIDQQIVSLNLNKMPVTDADLKWIASLENLERLNLNFTSVTGSGLKELLPLKRLNSLSLSGTAVAAADVEVLSALASLRSLYLWNTPAADSGITRLRQVLKGVAIEEGFADDGGPLQLNPPRWGNSPTVFEDTLSLVISHPIQGVNTRYTLDGSEPDSVRASLYSTPLKFTDPVVKVSAKAFKDGWKSSDVAQKMFLRRKHLPDSVALGTAPHEDFAPNGIAILTDGEVGDTYFQGGSWLGYREKAAEVQLYFDHPVTVSSVTLDLLRHVRSHIFPPQEVEIWGLRGETWERLGTWKPLQPTREVPALAEPHIFSFPAAQLKALKIVATPLDRLPSWHQAKGERAWLFVDEVLVN